MERQEITSSGTAGMLENVLVGGDLSKLSAGQRLDYYRQVCQSMGLNPLSKPFDYIILNGRMTLYAKKDAADQLRKINGVSVDSVDINKDCDYIVVTVRGHDKTGRSDVEVGVVSKRDMRGDLGNVMMKAVTKAKRRLTLSLCGLGWLDETEVETIPDAKPVAVDDDGAIMVDCITPVQNGVVPDPPEVTKPAENRKPFDEVEFLRKWTKPADVAGMSRVNAEKTVDSNGQPYGEKSTYALFCMMRAITKKLSALPDEQKPDCQHKIAAICEILQCRKVELTLPAADGPDPFIGGELEGGVA